MINRFEIISHKEYANDIYNNKKRDIFLPVYRLIDYY